MTEQEMIKKIEWTMQNKSHNKEFCLSCIQALKEVEQYRALGTVEELKEANERQIAKKPIVKKQTYGTFYLCPVCNANVNIEMEHGCEEDYRLDYCDCCGQALNRSEEDV